MTLKWDKMGRICSWETFNLPWYRKNTMVPVPFVLNNTTLRIFLTMCDGDNIGRIGFIDVDPGDPGRILGVSEHPVLDIGHRGTFDDSGVLPSCLYEEDGRLYMLYSAYQRKVQVPYTILSGLAYSDDGGSSFTRYSKVPLLEVNDQELFIRSAPFVLKERNVYRLWYSSGSRWTQREGKAVPRYAISLTESDDLFNWVNPGRTVLELEEDEYGLTTPHVRKGVRGYDMVYSIRSHSKGYRLGYAQSKDGLKWSREDDMMQLDVSDSGWDKDMVCFGNLLTHNNRTYLFYCGNHYGMEGMGYAELIKE